MIFDMPLEHYSSGEHFEYPRDDERAIIIGRTGSGKTQLGFYLLAMADWDTKPWIILDYKGEELFKELQQRGIATVRDVADAPPTEPGLYIIRPTRRDEAAVETLLHEIWARENIGLFVDELYMIDARSEAYQDLLTQGRSRHIPVIGLTQRPAWVSRFNFSESSHVILLDLNDLEDRKTVARFMPIDRDARLPDYHSRWFNVNRNRLFHIQPAPGKEKILELFQERAPQYEAEEPASRRNFL